MPLTAPVDYLRARCRRKFAGQAASRHPVSPKTTHIPHARRPRGPAPGQESPNAPCPQPRNAPAPGSAQSDEFQNSRNHRRHQVPQETNGQVAVPACWNYSQQDGPAGGPAANGQDQAQRTPSSHAELIKRFKLKQGNFIEAQGPATNDRFPTQGPLHRPGSTASAGPRKGRMSFQQMVHHRPPDEHRIKLAVPRTAGCHPHLDTLLPHRQGTRGLIVAPPRHRQDTLLHEHRHGVAENPPGECHLIVCCSSTSRTVRSHRLQAHVSTPQLYASSNARGDHLTTSPLPSSPSSAPSASSKRQRRGPCWMDSIYPDCPAPYNPPPARAPHMTGGLDVRALEKPRQRSLRRPPIAGRRSLPSFSPAALISDRQQ